MIARIRTLHYKCLHAIISHVLAALAPCDTVPISEIHIFGSIFRADINSFTVKISTEHLTVTLKIQ